MSDTREKIVKGALELFTERGIRSITMDFVASYLSMSKRTIYECFENKEMLVMACLKHHDAQTRDKMTRIQAMATNSFEEMVLMIKSTLMDLQGINVNFFLDIKKMFPNLIKQKHEIDMRRMEQFAEIIREAQCEGLVMPELDVDVVSSYVSKMITSFQANEKKDEHLKGDAFYQTYRIATYIFLRGIATEKGMALIDKYQLLDMETEKNNN